MGRKNSITRTCQMCGEEKILCKAHIMPKALISILKNPDNDYVRTSFHKWISYRRNTLELDRKILCRNCDGILGEYDEILVETNRQFFFHEARKNISETIEIETDTKKLNLGIAAIIYRMSISKRIHKVRLDIKYEMLLKRWLQNGSIPEDMKSWFEVIFYGYSKHKKESHIFHDPFSQIVNGNYCYLLLLPGLLAAVKVGKAKWGASNIEYPRITQDPQRIRIPIYDFEKTLNYKMLFLTELNIAKKKGFDEFIKFIQDHNYNISNLYLC